MIYLIITTCIDNKIGVKNDDYRKKRYIDSIEQVLRLINDNNLQIKPIIVENNGVRQTYLNELNCEVCYTDNNKFFFKEKAVNELLDIKEVINRYYIQDDDIIIKLTGRYKLLNLDFCNLVKNNSDKFDAFIKFFNVCTLQYMADDCVLGLYAIKCKYLKDFNYYCIRSPECEFAIYVRDRISNIIEIKNLNLECCFADDLRILYV